jgi:hypothetical protein
MRLALASALTLALAAQAAADDKQVWEVTKAGKEVILFFGIPESHAVTILFNCTRGEPVSIVTVVTPPRVKTGQAAKISLSNGALTAIHDGKIGRDNEGYHVEARVRAEPKILDVLRTGAALTIGVANRKERVPLRGVARPLAEFEKACLGV